MTGKYKTLLSPIRIGNTVFRNRLFAAPTGVHALQGGEPYPTQALIEYFANKAKGGAALVTVHGMFDRDKFDGQHIAWDGTVLHNQHYLSQMADAIHFYGAKASMEIRGENREGYYDVVEGLTGFASSTPSKEMTPEIMDEIAESYADTAAIAQRCGFDMCMIHMAYASPGPARFISPHFNKRTDEYGGPIENRLKFPIMVFDRIKERCGKNFLIEFRVSGAEPQFDDGIKVEDTIAMSKILEGHVDMLHLHGGEMWSAHPTCFAGAAPFVPVAEQVRKAGSPIPIVAIGGIQDLDEIEEILYSGKADIVSMGRGWIADPFIGMKAYEDRGADVVPCIRCMRCHDSACLEDRSFVCSVNPCMGIEHNLVKSIQPPKRKKKVAVIGGGPAGMKAALELSERGHSVTLFEKTDSLGGQLNFADFAEFKHGLKKFKNYLLEQIGKSDIKLKLGYEASVENIREQGFDEVVVALGAGPVYPPIKGIDSPSVIPALDVYGKEDAQGDHVLILGGGQVGCETAVHLARSGKKVHIIEMQEELAPDASFSYRLSLMGALEKEAGITKHTGHRCTSIGDTVICVDADGKEKSFSADKIILAAGMCARTDEGMNFYQTGIKTAMIGDCEKIGNVSYAIRSAYAAASQI